MVATGFCLRCGHSAMSVPSTKRGMAYQIHPTSGNTQVLKLAELALPDQIDGMALRVVAPAELAAANIWVTNWQRMLPVINATRTLLPRGLAKSVLSFVHEPIALARIEHQFSIGDPPLIRGVIFELLRTGGLCAPALHTQPLSLHTLLEPAS